MYQLAFKLIKNRIPYMDVLCEKIVDFHREPIPLNINIDINKIKISHNKRNSISLDVKK